MQAVALLALAALLAVAQASLPCPSRLLESYTNDLEPSDIYPVTVTYRSRPGGRSTVEVGRL